MIALKEPISISIPAIKKSDGTLKEFPPIVLKNIDYIVTYDDAKKIAYAIIKGVNRQILLWSGDAYTKAGQFTDDDVLKRVDEITGKDKKAFIEGLFKR